MRKIANRVTIVCLAAAGLTLSGSGCGKEDSSTAEESTQKMSAASSAPRSAKAAAGASANEPVAPGDQIGASAVAPQGDCPEGYACTRVLFPENERICMKPGETFAPACDASDKCPDIPKADCVDTGTAGKVCTQFCKV